MRLNVGNLTNLVNEYNSLEDIGNIIDMPDLLPILGELFVDLVAFQGNRSDGRGIHNVLSPLPPIFEFSKINDNQIVSLMLESIAFTSFDPESPQGASDATDLLLATWVLLNYHRKLYNIGFGRSF